jgi:hypothetical protein
MAIPAELFRFDVAEITLPDDVAKMSLPVLQL